MCAFKNASVHPGAQFHARKNQLIFFQHSVPKIPFINIPYRIYHKDKSRKVVYNMYKNRLVLVLSHVRLFCDPMDSSPPGSSVHGILQARILEWVVIPFSRRTD